VVSVDLDLNAPRAMSIQFFLAPETFPVRCAVVGNGFLRQVGHPYQLFPDKQRMHVMVQQKVTASQENR
jgi:hypothetical protein